ncbi:hypothetical protein T08_9810 [Trichinella sp. T8]|nr:hypothetical protein T08_9810 [Trichinella sp. T8]
MLSIVLCDGEASSAAGFASDLRSILCVCLFVLRVVVYQCTFVFFPKLSPSLNSNKPLSRAGSFVASTGLLPQASPNEDSPMSTCGFISASVSSVRLLPDLTPLLPNSRFVGNILALKRQNKNTIFIVK